MSRLFEQSPEWETAATFDFSYHIDDLVTIDGETEDVVYVLRRRSCGG